MSKLSDQLGLTEEELQELDLEIHENAGSSGEMIYGYYFVVSESIPPEILEKTTWNIGDTVNIPINAMDDDHEAIDEYFDSQNSGSTEVEDKFIENNSITTHSAHGMKFYKGSKDILEGMSNDEERYNSLSAEFTKLLDVKNLSFLLGAGCSSLKDGAGNECGILTMAPLAKKFYDSLSDDDGRFLLAIHIAYKNPPYEKNLEAFFEAILNYRNYLYQIMDIGSKGLFENKARIDSIVNHLKEFILRECTEPFENNHDGVLNLYKKFYRKLIFRDRNLPKPNVFTTNYDVFSEKAMDSLNVHFSNGFSGVIDRYFNPSVFDYAFAESMDVFDNKWQVIDHFVYLYKLHGSINWIWKEGEGQLFSIKEIQDVSFSSLSKNENIMIYPSPAKQNTSLSSPYTDLFRELKFKISKSNSVLVIAGYSFGDEHINNIIYQSLAKPSFRLVILGRPESLRHLLDLGDPRVWIIGGADGAGASIHYFQQFVNKIMPELSEREIEESVDSAIKTLVKRNVS